MGTAIHLASSRAESVIATGLAPLPDVVKIDVEGWEYEVVQGFGQILDRDDAPSFIFENEPYRLRERGRSLDAVPSYLQERGYRLSFIADDGRLAEYDARDLDASRDIWASKALRD